MSKKQSNAEQTPYDSYDIHMSGVVDPTESNVDAIGSKSIRKYKKTISYIEEELYTTLNYLNNQLDIIDTQVNGIADPSDPTTTPPFNRNVYDSKKQIVEQKLVALRSLAGIAAEQVKVTSSTKEGEITNITDLFQ